MTTATATAATACRIQKFRRRDELIAALDAPYVDRRARPTTGEPSPDRRSDQR